jgi:hypothetical protein
MNQICYTSVANLIQHTIDVELGFRIGLLEERKSKIGSLN